MYSTNVLLSIVVVSIIILFVTVHLRLESFKGRFTSIPSEHISAAKRFLTLQLDENKKEISKIEGYMEALCSVGGIAPVRDKIMYADGIYESLKSRRYKIKKILADLESF